MRKLSDSIANGLRKIEIVLDIYDPEPLILQL